MERINIISFGVVLLKSLMLPLFTIACLRKKVHVGSRGDQGADVLDGVRLHSSSSTWRGCIRVVFVCPHPPALVWGWFSSPRLKIQLVDPVGVTGGDRA